MFFPYADEAHPEGRVPWMNWLLIIANALIFVSLGTRTDYEVIVFRWGFTPAEFVPATLFTSIFLHGSWMHLLSNMWFLHLFGDNVEARCGPLRYLLAYLACGLAGSLCQYYFFSNSHVPSIGASGAIFGVMGMYAFFFPGNRIKVFYFIFIIIGVVAVRAIWVMGMFFGLELLYSRAQTLSGVEGGVGHLAHSGGFAGGLIIAALYSLLGIVPSTPGNLWRKFTGKDEEPWSDDEGQRSHLREVYRSHRERRPGVRHYEDDES